MVECLKHNWQSNEGRTCPQCAAYGKPQSIEESARQMSTLINTPDLTAYLYPKKPAPIERALETQIAGNHYKTLAIQPVEYIHKNNIGFCEGSAIKYLTRWRSKGGIEDLKKAKHFIDLLIELETAK